MGVPAFKVDSEYFVGLDLDRIQKALDYSVEKCPHCENRMRIPKGKGKLKITCKQCENSFLKQT